MKEMLLSIVVAIVGVTIGACIGEAISPTVRLKQSEWVCKAKDFSGCIEWERIK